MDNKHRKDSGVFRDYIPAGEKTGAITGQGFTDFVPSAKEPTQTEKTEPVKKPVSKK
jgi:hypothetical protein